MSDDEGAPAVGPFLTAGVVLLVLFAVAMFAVGEYLIAGVTFLTLTFAIYLRETLT